MLFFVLVAFRSYNAHFHSKRICEFMELQILIFFEQCFRYGAQFVMHQIIFQHFYECSISFLYSLWLESRKISYYKNTPASSLQLQILKFLKQLFRHRAQCIIHRIIFQYFYGHSMSFLYLL